jgi:dienelactone hydrolase
VRDYLGDGAGEFAGFLASAGVAAPVATTLLGAALHGSAGAAARPGAFPLVLVAQGNGQDAIDQVVLCEFLASRGYVVVTVPSPMRATPMTDHDEVGRFAERQATDLLGAIHLAAAAGTGADTTRVGVVGHSFGARAALLVAMRNPRVRALVSLDGGIGTATAIDPFRRAPSFDPAAALPPLLHLFEELDAFMTPEFSLLRSLRFRSLALEPTREMHHVHFTTWGFAAAALPEIAALTGSTVGTSGSVRLVSRRTVEFLDRYLH